MSIRWIDTLVVVFARLHNLEAEPLVELDRILVVHLHVQEDADKLLIVLAFLVFAFDISEHVLDHLGANAQPAIGSETTQCHDIKPSSRCIGGVQTAAHRPNEYIVVVSCLSKQS